MSPIAALWVPDGQHYVEGREARGYEALEKRIRGSHEKNVRDDGNRFRAAKDVRRLRDVVTFHWEMLPADSETVSVSSIILVEAVHRGIGPLRYSTALMLFASKGRIYWHRFIDHLADP